MNVITDIGSVVQRGFSSLLLLLALCMVLASCDTAQTRRRMADIIAEADSMNRHYAPMASDSLLLLACRYYDRHGTPNERMRAHYLLGCAYRDMGEAPVALQCFYDAIDQADTLTSSCDYETLRGIYGQMAELFHRQNLPFSELTAIKQYGRCAWLLGDTCDYVNSIAQMAKPYYLLDKKDSVLLIINDAYLKYVELGQIASAAALLPPAIYINIERGNYREAKRLMDLYEEKSGLFDAFGNIARGREHYYCNKGVFLVKNGQVDSAEHYFRKAIPYGYHIDAYRGLLTVYRQKKETDSITKYSLLFEDAVDKGNQALQTASIQQSTSLYNYSRNQKIAEQSAARALKVSRRFFVACILLLLSILGTYCVFRQARKNQQKQRKLLAATMAERAKIQEELRQLKDKNYDAVITQKEKEIDSLNNFLKEQLAAYHHVMAQDRLSEYETSGIVHLFKEKAEFKFGVPMPTEKEWNQLVGQFREDMPGIYTQMTATARLSDLELRTCILLMLGFNEGTIAALSDIKPQTLNTVKSRANNKLFNIKGSATLRNNLLQMMGS